MWIMNSEGASSIGTPWPLKFDIVDALHPINSTHCCSLMYTVLKKQCDWSVRHNLFPVRKHKTVANAFKMWPKWINDVQPICKNHWRCSSYVTDVLHCGAQFWAAVDPHTQARVGTMFVAALNVYLSLHWSAVNEQYCHHTQGSWQLQATYRMSYVSHVHGEANARSSWHLNNWQAASTEMWFSDAQKQQECCRLAHSKNCIHRMLKFTENFVWTSWQMYNNCTVFVYWPRCRHIYYHWTMAPKPTDNGTSLVNNLSYS